MENCKIAIIHCSFSYPQWLLRHRGKCLNFTSVKGIAQILSFGLLLIQTDELWNWNFGCGHIFAMCEAVKSFRSIGETWFFSFSKGLWIFPLLYREFLNHKFNTNRGPFENLKNQVCPIDLDFFTASHIAKIWPQPKFQFHSLTGRW